MLEDSLPILQYVKWKQVCYRHIKLLGFMPEKTMCRFPELNSTAVLNHEAASNSLPSFLIGMDQHGANHSQSDSNPSRPDLHGPAASSVPMYQPAHLSCDWHQSSSGCEGMAWKSGPRLWHHRLEDSNPCGQSLSVHPADCVFPTTSPLKLGLWETSSPKPSNTKLFPSSP